MKILKSGFYVSDASKWIDMHAGHKFEGITYEFIVFMKDGTFFKIADSSPMFNPLFFIELKSIDAIKKDTSITSGKYFEVGNAVEFKYSVWGENRIFVFTFLAPNRLLNDSLKEYHFKYVVGIEYNKFWLEEAIKRGDDIWSASNPIDLSLIIKNKSITVNSFNDVKIVLSDPNLFFNDITGFGREIKKLIDNEYTYDSTTKMFVK
ncbi:MAG: hypothetical protein WBP45_07135 [Daejeonella sp.]